MTRSEAHQTKYDRNHTCYHPYAYIPSLRMTEAEWNRTADEAGGGTLLGEGGPVAMNPGGNHSPALVVHIEHAVTGASAQRLSVHVGE